MKNFLKRSNKYSAVNQLITIRRENKMLECLQYVLLSLTAALGITEGVILGVEQYRNNNRPRTIAIPQEVMRERIGDMVNKYKESYTKKVDKIVRRLKDENRYSPECEQKEKEIREKIEKLRTNMKFMELSILIDEWEKELFKT